MNPDALFVADAQGLTSFDQAIISVNEWAIEHFQWKLSIWSIEEALVKETQRDSHTASKNSKSCSDENRDFEKWWQGECERPLLLLSLPRDCVHLIISDHWCISGTVFLVGGGL